jgi:3-deoxy-D-manno-octulosonic-acid transferase
MHPLVLDLAYVPLAILYLPFLLYQMAALKKNRRGWGQRLGFVRRRVSNRPCIWIHAVSLGEVNATRRLVAEIERRLPHYDVAISTTTDTGHAAALKHYQPKPIFRYPLDFSGAVTRVLDRIRPDVVVLMELEAWPNFVTLTSRRRIPIMIANGRVTEDRSMRRFRRPIIRDLARQMFSKIAFVGAQNDAYAARFAELGVPPDRIFVTGSMKYDTAVIADDVPGDEALARALSIDRRRPLIVAGSTGPGEEELLLRAYRQLLPRHPGLQLALIPRRPERFNEVARLIEGQGFACTRRSERPDLTDPAGSASSPTAGVEPGDKPVSPQAASKAAVFLGDTMGELRKAYSLADVVFVGRSLVRMGGSDLTEVAGLGKPMCFGPHVENFLDIAEELTGAQAAVRLRSAGELASTLHSLLSNQAEARAMGLAAQEVVRRNRGATGRTVDLLCQVLGRRADHPASSISTVKIEPLRDRSPQPAPLP